MGEPSRSQAVHEAVQTRGLSLPLAGAPANAGGDPEQQTVSSAAYSGDGKSSLLAAFAGAGGDPEQQAESSAGDGGGDGRIALIAALAREASGGPLATPEAYFEHFAVFDPKHHKVREAWEQCLTPSATR